MKTAPFRWRWFLYWTFTGKGHPEHIKWWADEYARERRARQALGEP